MDIVKIGFRNRALVTDFLIAHWYTTKMVIRGQEIDMTKADGFYIWEDGRIIGLITYFTNKETMEITSLDSLRENQGIGTLLLQTVIEEAKKRGCTRIVLITTNDNINALRFYQKRGFDMAHLYRNALEISRKLKPEIPLTGADSIPLKHEIEFEMLI